MPSTDTPLAGPSRRSARWLWILAGALFVARVTSGVIEERHPPAKPDFVEWVPAEKAPALSAASGKPILYDFSAEWCGPCQVMAEELFRDEKLAGTISGMVIPVHVVDRQREEGRNSTLVDSLERVHKVKAFPTLVLVDPLGKPAGRLEGYPGASQVVAWVSENSVKARMGDRKPGLRVQFP